MKICVFIAPLFSILFAFILFRTSWTLIVKFRPALQFLLPLSLLLLMHCENQYISSPTPLEPAPVALEWRIISHLESPDTFTSELKITNTDETPLSNTGWTLYFNFIRMIDASSLPATVQLTHINGDFFKLEPTPSFPPLALGEQINIPFEASHWAIKKSDAPAGFYMVYTDEENQDANPRPVTDYTVGSFETPAQTMRNANDEVSVPTPASRFADHAPLKLLEASSLPPVIPTPKQWTRGNGILQVSAATNIHYGPGLVQEAQFLAASLSEVLTGTLSISESTTGGSGTILLMLNEPEASKEVNGAYNLSISTEQGVLIKGADPAGVFYGIQTLRGVISPEDYQTAQPSIVIPELEIQDQPRFSYRGLHLDVSRNFHSKESVLKVLDLMAFYKLNTFHFHLTDDEGWRLEINGLPELTSVGSRRGHTLDEQDHLYPSLGSGPNPDQSNGSGFYSRQDFIEILKFAHARHIEVIPEIDLPGHARAAIRAMETRYTRLTEAGDPKAAEFRLIHPEDTSSYRSVQMWDDNVIDVCQSSTYAFIERVINDIMIMYQEAGVTLQTLHTGNDEVPHGAWSGSPACANLEAEHYNDYFLQQLHQMLEARRLNLAGWEEIALREEIVDGVLTKQPNPAFVDSNFRPYVWNAVWGWGSEGTAYKLANAGYKIVLSNATNLYFDFAYDKDPEEPGFYWAGFSNTRKAFAFNPFDLYQNASTSLFGQPINAELAYRSYPRLTVQGRQNILGIQGQLWSENGKGAEMLEYQLFPKILGLAERAWAPEPEWFSSNSPETRSAAEQAGWNIFANQLGQRELPRLDVMHGIRYRIPPPGVTVIDGKVEANVAFPGLTIRYTKEDRLPTVEDPVYSTPLPYTGMISFSAFASDGRASRTTRIGAKALPE